MKKARYKAPEPKEFDFIGSEVRLPTSKAMAVYYRQSTFGQLGNISTAIQIIDMPEYIVHMGWSRDLVQLIDMDAGVSGTKTLLVKRHLRTTRVKVRKRAKEWLK